METEARTKQSLYQCAGECLERATRMMDTLATLQDGVPGDMTFIARQLLKIRELTEDMGFSDARALAQQMNDTFGTASASREYAAVRDELLRGCEHLRRHALSVLAGQTPSQVPALGEIQEEQPVNLPSSDKSDVKPSHGSSRQLVEGARERRRNMRFLDDVHQVQIQLDIDADICDESFGGVGLRLPEKLAIKPSQVLQIRYKGVPMSATVIRTQAVENGTLEIGLEWL